MACMAAAYTGCTDLTEEPYTFIDPNSYYNTPAEIETSLNYAYRTFRDMASSCRNYWVRIECTTELGEPNYRKEQPINDNTNLWNDINNVNYTFSDVWKKSYIAINSANIVIGRCDEMKDLSDADYKKLVGQARFLRAYSYYHIVRLYGGCPIQSSYTSSTEGLEIPRSTAEEVYAQIEADLKYASENLPSRGDAGYDVWRATCGSADALLSEMYLYRATIANEDNLQADKALLQLAQTYADKVIKSGKYSLVPDFKNVWGWFAGASAKNNSESIFELQFAGVTGQTNQLGQDMGTGDNSGITGVCSAYYNRYNATGEAYRSYNPADQRRALLLTEFNAFKDGITYTYNADLEEECWRDKNGNYWNPEKYAYHTLLNARYLDNWDDPETCRSLPGANIPLLRYSEVLLNYAEASNLLSAGSGLDKLNEVHQRAGLPKLAAMGQKEMDDAILQERLWEFIGEGKAYYDELRKGAIATRVEPWIAKKHAIYLKNELLTSATNSRKQLRFSMPMQFKPKKSFLWKIPSNEMSSNPLLEQNPDNVSK